MKTKYNPSYRSYIATMKRKRSEALFEWLKNMYIKSLFEAKITPKQIENIATGRVSGVEKHTCNSPKSAV